MRTTMSNYIDRDALIDLCDQIISEPWNARAAPDSWKAAYEAFKDDLSDATLADVAPVRHGKWKTERAIAPKLYICSECHAGCYSKTKYCPCCGADMSMED